MLKSVCALGKEGSIRKCPVLHVCDAEEEGGKRVVSIFLSFANKYTPDFMIENTALV